MRLCIKCGVDISNRHKSSKYCVTCAELEIQESKKKHTPNLKARKCKCGKTFYTVKPRPLCPACNNKNKEKIVDCFVCSNAYVKKCDKIKTGSKKFVEGSKFNKSGKLIYCPNFKHDYRRK